MERAQVLCVIGREVQFTGLIRDYDTEKCMWATEVSLNYNPPSLSKLTAPLGQCH